MQLRARKRRGLGLVRSVQSEHRDFIDIVHALHGLR
jgi:hypothetical protein